MEIASKYGMLTPIDTATAVWTLKCDCGKVVYVRRYKILSGNNRSCGCRKASRLGEATKKHGRANSSVSGYKDRAYGIWQAMKDRCSNSNRSDFHCYGGKGITVCADWGDFGTFIADMGEPPQGYTLERIDTSKGYNKQNCVWADRKTQAANTSRNRTVVVNGVRRLAAHVATENGVNKHTYKQRLYVYGWTIEEACGLNKRSDVAVCSYMC